MIKINELRQGNLVWTKACGRDAMIEWDWTLVANGVNTLIKVGGSEVTVNPVKLSCDMLSRIGFREVGSLNLKEFYLDHDNVAFSFGNYALDREFGGRPYLKVEGEKVYIRTVNYVHQLQNFYFALTGQELIKYKL